MAYTELLIRVERSAAEAMSDALLEAGALSAAIEDADAGNSNEEPLFGEPGGEPEHTAWQRSVVIALFDQQADVDSILINACEAAGIEALPSVTRRAVADQDWVRLTQSQFDPIRIGERMWIVPSWHDIPEDARHHKDAVLLRLDPGLAFGTGSHPTTRLCLSWLEGHLKRGASVIDYGCGSGILAIAARLLGAGAVCGTDIDPHAVSASIANAEANGVVARFTGPDEFHAEPADVVVANILSNPLKVLAPLLCDLVAPGGTLILSGILERQWREVADVYAPMLELDLWRVDEGWVCLVGRRPLMAEPDWATRCPGCETVFSFSLDEIRGHAGRVRCGACGLAFNALEHALDPKQFSPKDAGIEATTPQPAAEAGMMKPQPVASTPAAIPREPEPLPASASGPDATARTQVSPTASFLDRNVKSVRPPRSRARLLGLLCVLLLLLAGVQGAMVWRDELAAYWPWTKPILEGICEIPGCHIEPLARIDDLAIESAELQTQPEERPGYLYIALLRNRSALPLRYPDIDLVLTDAAGRTVLQRQLTPSDYLDAAHRARRADGLPPNSELPVRVTLDNAPPGVTGFRSLLTYP